MSLLDVRNLNVTYRTGRERVHAVRGVDFSLEPGQTLGMAGESGSGKSTVALSLLRLLPRGATVTGTVHFRDDDLMTANWDRIRAVRWAGASVVFQGAMSALNPVQTIGDQIREPILLHEKVGEREARSRTAELLDSVGVPVQGQILELLADMVRDRQIGMIMISHDLSVLAATCERLAVMYAGRIVEIGPSRELIGVPRHPYTKALSSAFPRIGDPASRRAPAGLPGDPPELRLSLPGCAFHDRCLESMPD